MRYRGTPSDEPLTIDADCIAAYLHRMRRPGMAEFVRHLGKRVQEANQREARLIASITELQAKYEPPAPREKIHDPRPPAEASD